MAIVSSHTLNSVDGTHAGGIAVTLYKLGSNGTSVVVFQTATDDGGRFSETVEAPDANATYELVFETGNYFAAAGQQTTRPQNLREIVIRLSMPDPEERYHLPLMLAPNSYSVWWSS